MPYFTMNRHLSINSVLGACLNFRKDMPEFVPEFMRAEVEEKGGIEIDAPEGVEVSFEVTCISISNTKPVVCTVDVGDYLKARANYMCKVRLPEPRLPFTGLVASATADTFTIADSDLSMEAAPIEDGVVASFWPSGYLPGSAPSPDGEGEGAPPSDEATRTQAMHVAFEAMVLNGTAGDDHVPSVKQTSDAVGFKVTAAERDAAWDSFKAGS